jgi:hypothetical protein
MLVMLLKHIFGDAVMIKKYGMNGLSIHHNHHLYTIRMVAAIGLDYSDTTRNLHNAGHTHALNIHHITWYQLLSYTLCSVYSTRSGRFSCWMQRCLMHCCAERAVFS